MIERLGSSSELMAGELRANPGTFLAVIPLGKVRLWGLAEESAVVSDAPAPALAVHDRRGKGPHPADGWIGPAASGGRSGSQAAVALGRARFGDLVDLEGAQQVGRCQTNRSAPRASGRHPVELSSPFREWTSTGFLVADGHGVKGLSPSTFPGVVVWPEPGFQRRGRDSNPRQKLPPVTP